MKDKFGTRQLPTAELELRGTVAELISPPGRGIPVISSLLNVTRLHNSTAATGLMARALATARQWALNREAFGTKLCTKPLHLETLASMTAEYTASVHITMDAVRLLGLEESNQATESEKHLLRLLTPLIKLYTGKASVNICSEAIECCGGVGYLEGSGLPRCLRDAQVLPVWEGTTNVLALDMMRAVKHSHGAALSALVDSAKSNLSGARPSYVKEIIIPKIIRVLDGCQKELSEKEVQQDFLARDIALQLVRAYAASLLCHHAKWSNKEKDWLVFKRFCVEGQEIFGNNRWLSTPVILSRKKDNVQELASYIFPERVLTSRL